VIRISGPRAAELASELVRLPGPGGLEAASSHVLHRAAIVNPLSKAELDIALVTKMPAPRSYTGEDVVELSCHGNPVLLGEIVRLLVAGGARLGEPGEFTRRAYLNGRLDLLQVEAVAELIGARTERAVRLAARQLRGAASAEITILRERLVDLMAGLEVALDFPDEAVGVKQPEALKTTRELVSNMERLIANARQGRVVHDGLAVMLTGAPNVGKSSLFNSLLGTDRAIVSPTPGTTRDLVDGTLVLRGVPIRLVDGAGLGAARDPIDDEGMRRARQALAESDLVLVVLDMSRPISDEDRDVLTLTEKSRRIVIANKSDLPSAWGEGVPADCACSALTGAGLAEVMERLDRLVEAQASGDAEEGGITASLRVLGRLAAARTALKLAVNGLEHAPIEAVLVDLRGALDELQQVLGLETDEAVLDRIFASFCIGK
jgi:tRNA modification GTPase